MTATRILALIAIVLVVASLIPTLSSFPLVAVAVLLLAIAMFIES